jgi:hypothetical protein
MASFVCTWLGNHPGRIKCCCVSCSINTAVNGFGIKNSLIVVNAVPELALASLPCAEASIQAAPLIQNKIFFGYAKGAKTY